ncbi:MAG TPA: rod shape-determining protein MreC, partial [Enterobacteriaceae bacterium]|nr:rod shape-determining protein MreC [Enterobacteriaceae bacterium]
MMPQVLPAPNSMGPPAPVPEPATGLNTPSQPASGGQ